MEAPHMLPSMRLVLDLTMVSGNHTYSKIKKPNQLISLEIQLSVQNKEEAFQALSQKTCKMQ